MTRRSSGIRGIGRWRMSNPSAPAGCAGGVYNLILLPVDFSRIEAFDVNYEFKPSNVRNLRAIRLSILRRY
jgi:hypothetical protein